jgi:hypothetical protein
MNYKETKFFISALGLSFNNNSFNRVVPHNKSETIKHFLLKALLVHHFTTKGESVFTEYRIGNGIFDLFNPDRMTCYEIETEPSSTIYQEKRSLLQGYKDRIEIIILDAREFSDNIYDALKQLQQKVG